VHKFKSTSSPITTCLTGSYTYCVLQTRALSSEVVSCVIVARRAVYTHICSSLLHIPCHNAGPEALLWGRFCYHGDDTEQKESSLGTTRAMCMCVRTTTGIYRAGTFISPSVSQCQVMLRLIMLKDSHGICVLGTFTHRLTECDKIATVVENGVFYST